MNIFKLVFVFKHENKLPLKELHMLYEYSPLFDQYRILNK